MLNGKSRELVTMSRLKLIPPRPRRTPNPGSKGGIASAMKLSAEQRIARATNAGISALRRHGQAYYTALGIRGAEVRWNRARKSA